MRREIIIDIPNGYEIDKENSTFEKIVFKEIEKPKVYDDFDEYFDSLEAEKLNTYQHKYQDADNTLFWLLVMRDHYREVLEDGWKPDWNVLKDYNIVIILMNSKWVIKASSYYNQIFTFKYESTAERFLENFKEDLEKIKYLWQ